MAAEITRATAYGSGPGARVGWVGGPGWTQDEATVIGEIEKGRRYYVRVGPAEVNVVLVEGDGGGQLRTDPTATPVNHLLALPRCH